MSEPGQATRSEIYSQPDAWRSALDVLASQQEDLTAFYREGDFDQVIFTGCGSTYYLAQAAASLFSDLTGAIGCAFPASELWLYPSSSYPRQGRCLLVAVSRSGETTETLQACRAFKASGRGHIMTLSCYASSSLSALGDINLVLPSGAEESVAQTRAFSTLYLATMFLTSLWAGDTARDAQFSQLSTAADRLLNQYTPFIRNIGMDPKFDRFYFLGSGSRYGLAAELSLKMKEMSLSHSQPFHFMEFRHGPISMVTPSTLVVGLVSEINQGYEEAVLTQVRSMGAEILSIGECESDINFGSGIEEVYRSVLYLPVGQVLAFERSISKGLNPDKPQHLNAVVKL
jgi:glucosamine--fructose-6-phosphate aminotransferase (isomerizing)